MDVSEAQYSCSAAIRSGSLVAEVLFGTLVVVVEFFGNLLDTVVRKGRLVDEVVLLSGRLVVVEVVLFVVSGLVIVDSITFVVDIAGLSA